ncbi:hypothetical protein COV56_01515 [Candidatus Kuenenbacteria bacterium CG11_big_fil_rev_8_21_14_0_20_37_9]|uniref:Polymerase beta nucleotidyltransferase domain-containing protein n=2 Tax=Candidatus Kueneniibacteriota TaxID=1752740 RepID=A0A2M6XS97_9BACT|nr:MAG: hypothetical protein AUJ29_01620 [Candidatus Kuenenbacteria bacterium CG1_02_38_13]PIR05702.1 MAG: hypothetical protein COV56_01515 [Candidatus Kuenenbacteria bacterium CG11_big_fil_rev_8_21_14_0_20_37_9]PIU10506.1 MAG: hypothetical protein COT27_02885 [Candidatus Kuenenbacteria bacterium CG08_land_8_20_14_0_20_37_23]
MIPARYLEQIKTMLFDFNQDGKCRFFLFGSSLARSRFGDVDIGVMGKVADKDIGCLREKFRDSTLPYGVDVVDFNKVSKQFKNNVLNNKVLWITS